MLKPSLDLNSIEIEGLAVGTVALRELENKQHAIKVLYMSPIHFNFLYPQTEGKD